MIKLYWMIKKGQTIKKVRLYKQVFGILFDWTTMPYILGLGGYILYAVLSGMDLSAVQFNFEKLEAFTARNIWNIAITLPLLFLFRAFNDPGVIFSTAEYTLTHLPISKRKIWFMRAVERWVIAFIKITVIGMALLLISKTPILTMFFYIGLIVLVNMLMTMIAWKIYQLHLLKKVAILFFYLCVVIGFIFIDSVYISMGMLIVLLLINLYLSPRLFQKIHWQRIVAASDYRIWNMAIVSNVTKVKTKKEGKYSQWRILPSWHRPFSYQGDAVFHRLWMLYFEKNIIVLVQLYGGLTLFLTIFIFVKPGLFLTVLAISAIAVASLSGTMFYDRLQSEVVQVIAWDVFAFKRTLMQWMVSCSVLFVLPVLTYAIVYKLYYFPVYLLLYYVALYFILDGKLMTYIFRFNNVYVKNEWYDSGAYVLLISLAFARLFPIGLIPATVIAVIMIFLKSREKGQAL